MFKYEQTVLPYIQGEYKINDKGQLMCLCPFHYEENPSFNINLESGLYKCFSCRRVRKFDHLPIKNGRHYN